MAIESIGTASEAAVGRTQGDPVNKHAGASSPARAQAFQPLPDVAATLLEQIAASDLSKLSQILQPSESGESLRVLDTLLRSAIQQLANGNDGRAVGYLADYATRDPRRAETLLAMPELEPVRNQLEHLIGRMTNVARMSAEDFLTKAGQSSEEFAGKLPNWDTHSDILMKVAQRLFDAGGYANYSRTTELARALTSSADLADTTTPAGLAQGVGSHGLQAMSAAQGVAAAGVMVPGVTVPYVVSPFSGHPTFSITDDEAEEKRDGSVVSRENWDDFKELLRQAFSQVWNRAPLLVLMMGWLTLGIVGGIAAELVHRFSPQSPVAAITDLGFELWGLGFLALVAFGFWARVRGNGLR